MLRRLAFSTDLLSTDLLSSDLLSYESFKLLILSILCLPVKDIDLFALCIVLCNIYHQLRIKRNVFILI